MDSGNYPHIDDSLSARSRSMLDAVEAGECAMSTIAFSCPDCKLPLTAHQLELKCHNGHRFRLENGVYHLLPASADVLTLEDARYHGEQKDTWIEHNQVSTYRNVFFHRSVLAAIAEKSGSTSRILEIGGGVGFDVQLFLDMKPLFGTYVFSEVSDELAAVVAARYGSKRVVCCTVDAQNLPFSNEYFDCVFMIATFHHFHDPSRAMTELVRVIKPGGLLCFGIEPNKWWVQALASTKGVWRQLIPKRSHSPADEETHGLTVRDFDRISRDHHMTVVSLEPVWLLCGFAHYGLEFTYRLFRLKQRIRLPLVFEKILVHLDRLLLAIPGLKYFSWHFSVIYQKA
jgi:ubiquinone/menaquinone biosynthesis C-methylase UbiE